MRTLLLALLLALLPAVSHPHGAETVVTSIRGRDYAPRTIATVEHVGLRLVQLDFLERHDIIALDVDPVTGEPLFSNAAPLRFGESESVLGVEWLEPGAYPFVCSLHEEMQGLLVVQEA